MKTPEEIKKDAETCMNHPHTYSCNSCSLYSECHGIAEHIIKEVYDLAVSYESDIETLKGSLEMWKSVASSPGAVEDMARENYMLTERLAQVERERDALHHDLAACFVRPTKMCRVCENIKTKICNSCEHGDLFKWRGVCAENTKEEEK